jgi:hypothetical protein
LLFQRKIFAARKRNTLKKISSTSQRAIEQTYNRQKFVFYDITYGTLLFLHETSIDERA